MGKRAAIISKSFITRFNFNLPARRGTEKGRRASYPVEERER